MTDGTNAANITFDNFDATFDFASDGNGGTLITDTAGFRLVRRSRQHAKRRLGV